MIPTKIYLFLLLTLIVIFSCAILYIIFVYQTENKLLKKAAIWYIIIIILNLLNIYYVMNFYEKNKFRKGKKGAPGLKGPRGLKGDNKICSSCGESGKETLVYAGNINDKGKRLINNNVSIGKCIFPFIDNYKYNYNCVKTNPYVINNKGERIDGDNDATQFGWCATKVNSQFEPLTYGYCNENSNIQEKIRLNQEYAQKRKDFLQNNFGIIDLKLVSGNTKKKARDKLNSPEYENYEFYDVDLNSFVEAGKFIYFAVKKGYGSTGIVDIKHILFTHNYDINPESNSPAAQLNDNDKESKEKEDEYLGRSEGEGGFERLPINANDGIDDAKQLYIYIKRGNTNFIKDIHIGEACDTDNGFIEAIPNLNEGVINAPTQLKLCISYKSNNILNINTAFTFKKILYIFRGNKFFKMSSNPISKSIKVENDYPQLIVSKWGKIPKNLSSDSNSLSNNKKSDGDCNKITDENVCNTYSNCIYDVKSKKCEDNASYDAAFTYGFDNKVYFFKGSKVYKYDDKKMKIATGYPKNISDIFKGVPDNISAVFTWSKDGVTYFFKGPFYYKYNDKLKKVEKGYPKKSNRRWKNMPTVIDAIFSLPFSIENDNNKTYVISGKDSYSIDNISDAVINSKNVDERFSGLEVTGELLS